ncbi:MAG: hypothetical protein QOH58_3349 [Thermoleophilaceae bacterium]|jgi:diguanylate cyclase (GGDEF)-like protein/PAS domain S-box-containing protein|nr:hypothetical protein [Thermoleophilaceae bacterium]
MPKAKQQNRTRRAAPRWLLVLWLPLVATVVAAVMMDVTRLQAEALERHEVAELLAHVKAGAFEQRLAASQAFADPRRVDEARDRVREAGADVAADLAKLQLLDTGGEQRGVVELATTYGIALGVELDLIEAREPARARVLDARTVTTLDRLVDEIELARPRARADAVSVEATARRRSVMSVLIGLVGILLPLAGIFHLRRRGRSASAREHRLEQSERRFRALVQNASDAILVLAGNGVIRAAHGASDAILGYDSGTLASTQLWDIVHPDDVLLAQALCGKAVGARAGGESAEWRIAHADGSWCHCEVAVADLTDDPAVSGLVLTLRDVSRRKELEEQLRHRAFHDPLTQLPNRALFLDRAEHALAREQREGGAVAVLFVDFDDFKLVNDRLGHAVGDELLEQAAQRLRACVRSADTAARLGGDEFGVLIEGVMSASEPVQTAERLLATIGEPFMVAGRVHSLRVSIGIAVSDGAGDDADDLMRRADVAMYAAKAHGEGRYELFDAALEEAFDRGERVDTAAGDRFTFFMRGEEQRAEVESVLARAEAPQMVVQPLLDLRSGLVAGYEALARFPGSDRPPNAWFSQAHRHGLGCRLEARAVERALALGGRPAGAFLSLNLSPSALVSDEVWAVLPEDLSGVVVEVTENELASRRESLDAALARLRVRGALLAVDDAGAGYAGLKQLMNLDPDLIKLDRTLVMDVSRHPTKAALIEAFASYANRTGAEVCAEGVESLEDLRVLAELDVTYAQGYAIARPGAGWPEVAPEAQAGCTPAEVGLASAAHGGPESGDRVLERIVGELSAVRTRGALHAALVKVAGNLDSDELHISVLDSTGTYLECVSGLGSALEGTRWLLSEYAETEQVLRAQETRQVVARDPDADPMEVELLRVQGIASMLMVPILYGGETVGLLEAYAAEERPWSRGQIYRARIIAYQLGAVLQRVGAATHAGTAVPRHSTGLDDIEARRGGIRAERSAS